ncbi:MAG TPA: MoxR family ATPase [Planctomycetota bacterium]|nr:MoxR family ATPase [Planctomycetota bacterium]
MASVEDQVRQFSANIEKVRAEVGKVIVGNDEIVEGVLTAVMTGGHVLLEGLPGLGKTRLIKSVADVLELKFSRIQCTPDLMPADIIGTTILTEDEKGRRTFQFQKGPIFGNIVLTDEINRATPKTQSALLQAMQEGAVTVGNETHTLTQPFFVLATQNPVELEGTYPLPEAQLDRFMLKLLVPASSLEGLVTILERTTAGKDTQPKKVLGATDILGARELISNVPIARPLLEYVAKVILSTQPDQQMAPASVKTNVKYGSSPRGAQSIVLAAKAGALMRGRFNVAMDDIRRAAKPALRHRLILNFEGEAAGVKSDDLVNDILSSVKEG